MHGRILCGAFLLLICSSTWIRSEPNQVGGTDTTSGEAAPEQALELLRLSLKCDPPIFRWRGTGFTGHGTNTIIKHIETRFKGDLQTYSYQYTHRTMEAGYQGEGLPGGFATHSDAVLNYSHSAKFSSLKSVSIVPADKFDNLPAIRLSCKASSKCILLREDHKHISFEKTVSRKKDSRLVESWKSQACDDESARNAKMALDYLLRVADR